MKYFKLISLLFLLFASVQCRTKKIEVSDNVKIVKGMVMDKTGTLPGADIKVKTTERKVNSDIDGNFKIEVREGEILVVSFIGMGSIEVSIDSKDFYEIVVPYYKPPQTRKMKRWLRKYARENNGRLEW